MAALPVEDKSYLQRKLKDHRDFCAVMFALCAGLAPGLWIWDAATDPAGSSGTVWLRLSMLLMLAAPALAFKFVRDARLLLLTCIAAIVGVEVAFVEILNRLHTGMTYGIGGFMLFLFMPLLLLAAFSVRVNLAMTILVAAIPQLLALLNIAHGFEHRHYAALIWPTALVIIATHLASDRTYRLRYAAESALELSSNTDPLTGLSNRRHFVPALEQEVARGRRLGQRASLLMLDIDHFKHINDAHGHPTGDRVICAVADICRGSVRGVDMVARLGGEEFAVLLVETDASAAATVAERIRSSIERQPMASCSGERFHITVSIGVCEQPRDVNQEERMIERADAALYQAKTAGRNRVVAA